MEWFYAVFCAFLSWSLFALGQHYRRAPDRWRERGSFSNGLGYEIKADESPRSFEVISAGSKAWGTGALFLASILAIASLAWLWKAVF